jgi:hypothetical protein
VKWILTLVGAIATLAAGVTAAVALGAGSHSPDTATGATTVTAATTWPDTATGATTVTTATTEPDTATGPTTVTTATSPAETTAVAAGATKNTVSSKVWVCHHTGSWKHPYQLIHISTDALPAHTRHGDVAPEADNSCPTTQPAGTKTHGRGNGQSNNAKTKHGNAGKGDDKPNDD